MFNLNVAMKTFFHFLTKVVFCFLFVFFVFNSTCHLPLTPAQRESSKEQPCDTYSNYLSHVQVSLTSFGQELDISLLIIHIHPKIDHAHHTASQASPDPVQQISQIFPGSVLLSAAIPQIGRSRALVSGHRQYRWIISSDGHMTGCWLCHSVVSVLRDLLVVYAGRLG